MSNIFCTFVGRNSIQPHVTMIDIEYKQASRMTMRTEMITLTDMNMNPKHFICLLLLCCLSAICSAKPRTEQEMIQIAQRFASKSPSSQLHAPAAPASVPVRSRAYCSVNIGGCFVVVGADDRLPEVLGWSDHGALDSISAPPALLDLLASYDEELHIIDSLGLINSIPQHVFTDSCPPLLTTEWAQGDPYNLYSPSANASERCPIGCGATAMAQIMKYWEYPERGIGSNSYSWKCQDCASGSYSTEKDLSAIFSIAPYDWANMRDTYPSNNYTTTEAAAIAHLMYHCAIAINTQFGYVNSSSTLIGNAEGLIKYFGYGRDMRLVSKSDIPLDSLRVYLHDELAAGRPILSRGADVNAGGHAFVCDGYDQDGYFHFNWGWSGTGDGYFLLTALNPVGLSTQFYFNNNVMFLAHIQPDPLDTTVAEYRMKVDHLTVTPSLSLRVDTLRATMQELRFWGLQEYNGYIGIGIYDSTGHQLCIPNKSKELTLPGSGWGWTQSHIRFYIPDTLAEGIYWVDVVYKPTDDAPDDVWRRVEHTLNSEGAVAIHVTDELVSLDPVPDTIVLSCADAATLALQLPHNTPTQRTFVVRGRITEMIYEGISRGQQRFWMADTPYGGQVLQCYWGNVTQEVMVGDSIELIGQLMQYSSTPEISHGEVVLIKQAGDFPKYDGTLSGIFTINAQGKKVQFAKGNLQYNASSDTWRFAENQYDYIGSANSQISSTYSGWIDLFGWGTSGWNSNAVAYQPYSTSTNDAHYRPGNNASNNLTGRYANADWGVYNAIVNGGNKTNMWRTPTYPEWTYLMIDRPNAELLQGQASIGSVDGYVILPDDFVVPEGLSFVPRPDNMMTNVYTLDQWQMMENAGALFLPCAGTRNGKEVLATNFWGRYWSSHSYESNYAYFLFFSPSYMYVEHYTRHAGLSVRLVKDILPEDVEHTPSDNSALTTARKCIIDGQLFIIANGKVYTPSGIPVGYK